MNNTLPVKRIPNGKPGHFIYQFANGTIENSAALNKSTIDIWNKHLFATVTFEVPRELHNTVCAILACRQLDTEEKIISRLKLNVTQFEAAQTLLDKFEVNLFHA